jgi:hypothetical protein
MSDVVNEYADAYELANRVLDRINADPDDDLAVLARTLLRTREAMENLLGVIDAAGLHNLSNGVQLVPMVWYVKAFDARNYARAVLSKGKP